MIISNSLDYVIVRLFVCLFASIRYFIESFPTHENEHFSSPFFVFTKKNRNKNNDKIKESHVGKWALTCYFGAFTKK